MSAHGSERTPPAVVELCMFLAGQGRSRAARAWLVVQILCWLFMAAVGMCSGLKWAVHWGHHHGDVGRLVGGAKTLGFMTLDVLAARVLWYSSHHQQFARKHAKDLRMLRRRAWALVGAGVALAFAQVLYWCFFLYDVWGRWPTHPVYMRLTSAAAAMIVVTSPGLICAAFPALAGRDEADAVFAELLAAVTADCDSGICDWDHVLVRYGQVGSRVAELSAQFSPMVRSWLWTVGLAAGAHGISMWLWIDKLSLAPPHAVYLTHVLAGLYALIFLCVYFMFTGMQQQHQALLYLAHKQLANTQVRQVAALMRALHYVEGHEICWTVELWPGAMVEMSNLRGRFLSVAFLGNMAMKSGPRLLKMWCHTGDAAAQPGKVPWAWRLPGRQAAWVFLPSRSQGLALPAGGGAAGAAGAAAVGLAPCGAGAWLWVPAAGALARAPQRRRRRRLSGPAR